MELKDAFIMHLYIYKGNGNTCDNRCGISLLLIAGKPLARVLLYWLRVPVWLLERSWDYCRMEFAARQLQENC